VGLSRPAPRKCRKGGFRPFFSCPLSGPAVAAGGGGDDRHRLAGLKRGLVAALQHLDAAVEAAHLGPAALAVAAAGHAARAHAAVGRQDGAVHLLAEAQGARGAVAGGERALAAGAGPEPEILDHDGEAHFEDSGSVRRELVMWTCTPDVPEKPEPSFMRPA